MATEQLLGLNTWTNSWYEKREEETCRWAKYFLHYATISLRYKQLLPRFLNRIYLVSYKKFWYSL